MESTITLDCVTYVVTRHFSNRPTTAQDLLRRQLEKKLDAAYKSHSVDRGRHDGL